MRINESRLRRFIRQVIKEAASPALGKVNIVQELRSEIMSLGKTESGDNLYPGPGGDEHLIEDRCREIEEEIKDLLFPQEGGKLYEMVRLACDRARPGSGNDSVAIMQCLQSDQIKDVTDAVIQSLGLR